MSHAISLDSVLNLPAMGIPVINYSPESTWEFGAAAQGYFRLPNQERTSILQLDGTYSLNHQWYINTQGNLYFGKKTTLLHPTQPLLNPLGNSSSEQVIAIALPPTTEHTMIHILPTKVTQASVCCAKEHPMNCNADTLRYKHLYT